MNEQCVETKVELAQNDERPELRSDVHHTSHQQPVSNELRQRHKQRLGDQIQHPMVTREKARVFKQKIY